MEIILDANDLKNTGLKITLPRLKIIEILENNAKHHVSAEDIYQLLIESQDNVSLATVYRVLAQFEKAEIVKKLNFENNQSVYELSDGSHHDHLLCVKCGDIEEFVDKTIEKRQQNIAEKYGYKLTDHCLYLYGICKNCQ